MNTTPEKKEFNKDQKKFEFTVYLNDNIIVQRFFSVIGFNNKSINSMNFKSGSMVPSIVVNNLASAILNLNFLLSSIRLL